MQGTTYATPTCFATPCADLRLLDRDCAALRLLRMMQAWAAEHIVEPGRGAVWIAKDWLRGKLGVSRSQYYRALARLRDSGWISSRHVADESGRQRPGFHVALSAEMGYATKMRPTCDSDATDMRPRCDFPTLKLSEEKLSEDRAEMSRVTRQSSLPGLGGAPAKPAKAKGRDPRLKSVAERVDAYERQRYSEHPRCARPKRSTPEAVAISVEAITRALERVVSSGVYETLEQIEERFRAVVELNWEAAERKLETWEWWTGSKMWAPQSLDRVLGWLDEPRNVVYLHRASGDFELPGRKSEGSTVDEILQLSPAEQQAEYDGAWSPGMHDGATSTAGLAVSFGGVECKPFDGGKVTVLREGDYLVGDSDEPVHLEPGDEIERDAMEQLSDCVERGDAPELATLMQQMQGELDGFTKVQVRLSSPRSLATSCPMELRRKSEYLKSTTPEQRDADTKAGRRPWEVK